MSDLHEAAEALREQEAKAEICILCGCTYSGWGHNAQPLSEGRCCDTCNDVHVIPERIIAHFGKKGVNHT